MTLTNTKDGIRTTSKMLPCAAAVCYLDNSECCRAAETMVAWPWSSSGVRSGLCNAASHPSGQNRVLSVLSLEMFAETTGHASTHSLQEDIKN